MTACSVCERESLARGYCNSHYKSWAKYGDPLYAFSEERKRKTSERLKAAQRRPGYVNKRSSVAPRTDEWLAKLSAAHKGKPKSAEHREAIRRARTGTKRGPETIEKMRAASTGRVLSRESRAKISRRMSGRGNPGFGKTVGNGPRGTWSEYRGVKFRSTWEVRFAKAMDALGVEWIYEPERFDFGDCTYLPDFLLPASGEYVEVKGWMSPEAARRISRFREVHPNRVLLVADGPYLDDLEHKVKANQRFI